MTVSSTPLSSRDRNAWTLFALVVGILVLLNVISVRHFLRLDLTRTQAYSLAKISKQYMRELEAPMTAKAFFSRNLPPPYFSNARYLRDLLEDYRAYSRGRFNYQFIDPADDPDRAREARSLGVYEVQLTAIEKDKFEQKVGYMGVALVYRDRREVIPLIQDTEGLEYRISSAIKKLLQKERKVIGVTQGHGEPALDEALSNFRGLLAEHYEVVPVDPAEGAIPERVDSMIVAGPSEILPEAARYRLDAFLRDGRSLAVLARMVEADPRGSMQGRPLDTGLPELLAAWGVKIHPNLVYDVQCQRITVAQRGAGFVLQNIIPYPPFPVVTELDDTSPINHNLERFTLPFTSSLELDAPVLEAAGLEGRVLAKSSPRAWEQRNYFMLNPQFIEPPQENEQLRQFDLVAALTGSFPSAFDAPPSNGDLPPLREEAEPSRLVVVGSVDFITNDFVPEGGRGGPEPGSLFAQNLVDWSAQDSALIEIRSKGASAPVLGPVPDLQRQTVKYFNIIGLPVIVILAGLFMWRRFRVRREAIAAMFKA